MLSQSLANESSLGRPAQLLHSRSALPSRGAPLAQTSMAGGRRRASHAPESLQTTISCVQNVRRLLRQHGRPVLRQCHAQRMPTTSSSESALSGIRWLPTLTALFAIGFLLGPPLDGFHTNVGLLEYDKLPLTIGSWKTSAADPLLLGTYYAVAGGLLLVLDSIWQSAPEQQQRSAQRASPPWVALDLGLLAGYLQLSSVMYDAGMPYSQIWLILTAAGLVAWRLADGSKQTLLLALISAAVCPFAELALMKVFGLWHYPRADFLGITSWTACCYAFYTVVVGVLARSLASKFAADE